ncbi:TPA: hypothetical protein ACPDJG_001196, partial [Pasteurella multocida]
MTDPSADVLNIRLRYHRLRSDTRLYLSLVSVLNFDKTKIYKLSANEIEFSPTITFNENTVFEKD